MNILIEQLARERMRSIRRDAELSRIANRLRRQNRAAKAEKQKS